MKNFFILIFGAFISVTALAGDITFSNINQTDMNNLVSDFTANFAPTSVSPARALGNIFGFELGVVGGVAKTKNIQAIVERTTGQPFSDGIPHGALFAAFSIPFGLTFELGGIPEVNGQNGGKFSYSFGGIKWNFWKTLVDLAVKANLSRVDFKYNQVISSVNTEVEFKDTIGTAMLMLSKNFIFIEPYIGVGTVRGDGTLSVNGTGTIFDTTYTTSQSANVSPNSGITVVGLNFNLFVLRIGAEYARSFNTDSMTAKLSVYF